jgi:hypothetical protein
MVPSSGKQKVLSRERHIGCAIDAGTEETERCFRGTKLGIPETRKRLDWAVIEASEVSRGLMKYGVL